MLWVIFGVLLLSLVQAFIPAAVRQNAFGEDMQLGPQDDVPPLPVAGQRAQRALRNLHETLPIFLTLALLHVVYPGEDTWGIVGGLIFLLARVAYLVLYIQGIPRIRSMAFGVALLGLIIMTVPLLGYLF